MVLLTDRPMNSHLFIFLLDERDISPTHKFYTSLQDGNPPEEGDEVSGGCLVRQL